MRPRLRADVRYARSPDGVYVRGSAGACTLTGATSYEWLDRLAPFLTGEHALSDLVDPLSADQRAAVEHLVRVLHEQHLLVDAVDDEPHALTEEELRVYEPEIAFLRYATDSAEHRFERLRSARVTLRGGGPVLAALLAAGLRSGWRRVSVRTDDDVTALRAVARAATRDDAQRVDFDREAGTDLLLCVSDRRDALVAAARDGARWDVPLGQVLVGGDEAWVTAVGPPDRVRAPSCWRRLGAWRDPGPDEGLLTGPVPGVIAAHVALAAFRHLTGWAAEDEEPVLTRIDLRDLTSRAHRPRPYAVTGRAGPDAAADGFHDRLRWFVDDRVGVLGRLDEDDLPQVPLAVCRASVSDPASALPAWAPAPEVAGWGGDREQARWRAALAGLATYASLVDARGGERPDLLTGGTSAVAPVALRVPYRAPVGVAAGRTWADAVTAGLRAHCEALVAARVGEGRPCDLPTAVRVVGDERASDLWRLLRAAAVTVHAVDLGGVLGVPAFALRLAGTTITSCATTAAEALRDALERAVLHWQCDLSDDVAVTRWAEGETDAPPSADPRCHALAAALRRAGRLLLAVPLVADDAVRDLVPCLVRVVADER
ncbi:hypothetical protein ACWEFJ_09210 [Actinosynnema sp. NPDC004786]